MIMSSSLVRLRQTFLALNYKRQCKFFLTSFLQFSAKDICTHAINKKDDLMIEKYSCYCMKSLCCRKLCIWFHLIISVSIMLLIWSDSYTNEALLDFCFILSYHGIGFILLKIQHPLGIFIVFFLKLTYFFAK